MQPDTVHGDAAEGLVQRLHAHPGDPAEVLHGEVPHQMPPHGQVGRVDLEQEAGGDDRLVLLAHGRGEGGEVLLVATVVRVPEEDRDHAGGAAGTKAPET